MHAFGMYLRSAFGQPWWWITVRQAWFVFIAPLLHFVAGILMLCAMYFELLEFKYALLMPEFFIWGSLLVAMAIKKQNVHEAIFSVCSWHCYTLATVIGAVRPVREPEIIINSRILYCLEKT